MSIVSKTLNYIIKVRRNSSIKRMFKNYFNTINRLNKFPKHVDSHLREWSKRWSIFGQEPLEEEYIAYRNYVGNNVDIVPNEIARCYIEPVLTPQEFQSFYNDKNSFGIIIPHDIMPKTYLRSIDGILYDSEYNPVKLYSLNDLFDSSERLIVKPSRDMGGNGVSLFNKKTDGYYDSQNNKLTIEYLLSEYKRNFLVQECIKQSKYMSQFNSTSVNTIRMATYRDVKTGKIHILGAVLRIGGKGAFVDNACSGGSFIGINEDGTLGKYACNQYGQTSPVYNDINFSTSSFTIPDFDKIKEFAKSIAKRLPHMSLFANDIAIDENGNPKLIEVNTTDFSYWLYQFNGVPVFGDKTNDILNHCKKEISRIKVSHILKL